MYIVRYRQGGGLRASLPMYIVRCLYLCIYYLPSGLITTWPILGFLGKNNHRRNEHRAQMSDLSPTPI